jgi:hypothetical protein
MISGVQTANASEIDNVEEDFNRTGKVVNFDEIMVDRLPLVKQKYASNMKNLVPEKQHSELVRNPLNLPDRGNSIRFNKGAPLSGIQSRSGHDADLSEIVST